MGGIDQRPPSWIAAGSPVFFPFWRRTAALSPTQNVAANRNVESPAGFDDRHDSCDAWFGILAGCQDRVLSGIDL